VSEPRAYRCTFDRVGRNHYVAPQGFAATNADDLAHAVYKFAETQLASREIEVVCDLDAGVGRIIVGGFRPAGTFTIEALPNG